jgi:hypothetical protein
VPKAVQAVLDPSRPAYLLSLFLVTVALAAAAAWRRVPSRAWVVPPLVLLAAYPQLVAVWNGDEKEVDRHALVAATSIRLSLLVLLCFAVGALVAQVDSRRAR